METPIQKLNAIMPAYQVARVVEEVRIQKRADRLFKQQQRELQVKQAAQEYLDALLNECISAIETMKTKGHSRTPVYISLGNRYQNIPGHVLHYGGRGQEGWGWKSRKPLAELEEMPFITAQKLMYEKGYYLLDESDPSKSFGCYISLYCQKPTDYDTRPSLWHGYNKLPPTYDSDVYTFFTIPS